MATYSIVPIGESADKYLALVERIRLNLAELYDTGRWKRYYTEAELLAQARELASLQDRWTEIAERSRKSLPAIEHWTAAPPDPSANETMPLRVAWAS